MFVCRDGKEDANVKKMAAGFIMEIFNCTNNDLVKEGIMS